MRNKKSKSTLTTIRLAVCILGGGDYSQMNPLVNSNILRGEQNLWDDGDQRYLVTEKMTLSGRHQIKMRPLRANHYLRSARRDTAAPKFTIV